MHGCRVMLYMNLNENLKTDMLHKAKMKTQHKEDIKKVLKKKIKGNWV